VTEITKKNIRHAFIYLTNACNYNCIHCYLDCGPRRKNELSTKEVLNVIEQLHNYGVNQINLDGGEPFLRRDIFKILERINSLGIQTSIVTNASLLNEEIMQRIRRFDVKLSFSLDGATSKTNAKIRRNPQAFLNTINFIKRALELGLEVKIWYVVNALNIDEVPFLIESLIKEGIEVEKIKLLCFFKCSKMGRAERFWDLLKVDKQRWIKHLEEVKKIQRRYSFVSFEPWVVPEKDANFYFKNYGWCNLRRRELCYISCTGDVTFCSLLFNYEPLGNIREKTFRDIWDSSEIWDLWEERSKEMQKKCQGCRYLPMCRGGCFANAFKHGRFCGRDLECSEGFIPLCTCFFFRREV